MKGEDEETIEFLKRSNLRCLFGFIYREIYASYGFGYTGTYYRNIYIKKSCLWKPLVLNSEPFMDYPITNHKHRTEDYYKATWNRFEKNPEELILILKRIFKPISFDFTISQIRENDMGIYYKVNGPCDFHEFRKLIKVSLIYKGLFIPYGS